LGVEQVAFCIEPLQVGKLVESNPAVLHLRKPVLTHNNQVDRQLGGIERSFQFTDERIHSQFRQPGIRRPRLLHRSERKIINDRPEAAIVQLVAQLFRHAEVPEAIGVHGVRKNRLPRRHQRDHSHQQRKAKPGVGNGR